MTGGSLPRVIIVTGTDTDVGKTVVTAAIVAVLVQAGRRVAAYKPTQTGVEPGEPGEGAGGLLVELTEAGDTLADLATALPGSAVVVVARSGLGTLNHTMLTREALGRRQIRSFGVVIGAWPAQPSRIEATNRAYFEELAEGLLGAVPLGAPGQPPAAFVDAAATWLPGLVQRLGTP